MKITVKPDGGAMRVEVDALDRKPDQCTHCEHQAMHLGTTQLCCECYVIAGHPPADWHVVCMMVGRLKRRLTVDEWQRVLRRSV